MGSRLEICCGLQAVAHRRSARRGLLRPFHDANGPTTSRRRHGSLRTACPAHTLEAGSVRRAWPASAASRRGQLSTARSTRDIRASHCEWRRCAATPARSLTEIARSGRRSCAYSRLGPHHGDLLPFGKAKISPRYRGQVDRWHTASVTEPPRPHGTLHAARDRRVFARKALGDLRPERPLKIPAYRRTTR